MSLHVMFINDCDKQNTNSPCTYYYTSLDYSKEGGSKITLRYFWRNKVHSNNQKAILRYISGCNKPSIILTYVDKNR